MKPGQERSMTEMTSSHRLGDLNALLAGPLAYVPVCARIESDANYQPNCTKAALLQLHRNKIFSNTLHFVPHFSTAIMIKPSSMSNHSAVRLYDVISSTCILKGHDIGLPFIMSEYTTEKTIWIGRDGNVAIYDDKDKGFEKPLIMEWEEWFLDKACVHTGVQRS